jgi:hypothetical protein
MLVAMTDKTITLMQLVRVMQNLLMIPLPPTSMHRTMTLNPRRMLPRPRHLMRRPTMIRRLSHRPMRTTTMRRTTTLTRPNTTIKIHLPPMMIPALILSHDMHSL